jgi:hypothetical protein
MPMLRQVALAAVLLATPVVSASTLAEEWRTYTDPGLRYSIDLPISSFQAGASSGPSGHLTLTERQGNAVIDVYTGENTKHLVPSDFAAQLAQAGEIKDITYRASGRTWFVISGHYASGAPPLIYYAKYIFSDGLRSVAGFEISYSADEKARMDRIVEHLERSFRAR